MALSDSPLKSGRQGGDQSELKNHRGVEEEKEKGERLRGEKGPKAGLQEQPSQDQEEKRSQEKGRVGPKPRCVLWCFVTFGLFWKPSNFLKGRRLTVGLSPLVNSNNKNRIPTSPFLGLTSNN